MNLRLKTDGYLLAGINTTFNLKSSKLLHKIIIQADNLFDVEYYNHLSRIKSIMPESGAETYVFSTDYFSSLNT